MALQNIGASNRDDAFYRYKMPKLVTKVEGRGNGIKTNLVNMVDVAKALSRPPAYTTKYFGCELGAQSRFDEKTGTAIVNGAHETAKLSALLENFIKKYVQCYGCGNPETEIVISKTQLISLKCAACGFVSDVDMRDKLTTFIVKNPPVQKKKEKKTMRRAEKERLKEGEALDEEAKKGKKEAKTKKSHDGNVRVSRKKVVGYDVEEHSPASSQKEDTEEDEAEEEVQWQTDTSATAAQLRIKEQLTVATSELVMLNNADDDKEVHKSEQKALRKLSPKKESSTEPLDIYKGLVEEFKKCLEKGYNDKQLVQQLQNVQPQTSDQVVMNAYIEALFQGVSRGLAKDIKKKRLFLSEAVKDSHDQILLLGAVESHCSSGPSELHKEFSLVLKMLYELDIVEEDAVMTWYDAASYNTEVKRFAKPFVEWLKTAESEEE